ncbi:hypothetical protein BH24ACT15_BH24ACT15_04900 [soil metagenome]
MQLLDDNTSVIGIASRDGVDEMQAFVDRHGLTDMVTVADVSGEVWERFGVFGQPAWAFVDGQTGTTSLNLGALGQQGVLDAVESGGF